MTTLVPKIDLMNGGSTPTGAINRSTSDKLQDILSIKDFGAVGDGTTDNTTAIQNAINYLGNNGGTIFFPVGTYVVAGTLNLNNATAQYSGINLIGQSTPTGGANGSVIKFTASTGTRIVDARSSQGLTFEKMAFNQTNSGFTGVLFDFSHSTSGLDSSLVTFRDCAFLSTSGATPIDFTDGIISVFDNIHFSGGKYSIYANGAYFNAITITACSFNNVVNAPIYMDGSTFLNAVVIQQCTFEPLSNSSAGGVYINQEADGLIYTGNYCGDSNSSGVWFNCVGNCNGTLISGNSFNAGNDAVVIQGNAQGTSVKNNQFTGQNTAINISSSPAAYGDYDSNFWYTVGTPILGTPTIGTYQSGNGQAMKYKGQHIFDGSVANGVGGTISGSIWSVLSGGNVGISVQGTANLYQGINSSNTVVYQVLPSGNVQNANNSYGAISDAKLKDNIVLADSQWNDVKSLGSLVKKFTLKSDETNTVQLGMIAQDVQTISPKLVYETPDMNAEGKPSGTTTLGVNYSVMYMKAFKALGEALTRIESLESRLKAAGIA